MATPGLDVLNKRQFLTPLAAATRKAISGTVAQLGPMSPGVLYVLTADADCFFRQGATGMTEPTTSTGDPLWAKERVEIFCSAAGVDDYVDVITSGGAGTAYLTRQD
jgi:hypothetical protein